LHLFIAFSFSFPTLAKKKKKMIVGKIFSGLLMLLTILITNHWS